MGCDIHAAIEKKVGDRWIMVTRLHRSHRAMNRNYERFAALAGVRGDGPQARGLPQDISESTKLYVEEWAGDAHNHSFLDLCDAGALFLSTEWQGKELSEYAREYPVSHYFDIEECQRREYRLVFWFDN